jgi:hypothetical protein
MPAILRVGSYRFYFFSHDLLEPAHIHVDRERYSAKFWLEPIMLSRNVGFAAHELRRIENIIQEHKLLLMEQWNEHFNKQIR